MEPFGKRLRAARLERGITQKALAEFGGITPASLNLLEKGRNKMVRADVAIRMADAMNVSVRWLVLGDGPAESRDVDYKILGRILRFLDQGSADLEIGLSPEKKGAVVAALYQLAMDPDSVPENDRMFGLSTAVASSSRGQ
jgi:transcriptional regulator with XRE-family HTH domain